MKIDEILKEVLNKVNPPKEEFDSIDKFVKDFKNKIEEKLKSAKINAEVFVGGSFAKKTLIKKGLYDIDVFVRFDKKYLGKDISKLLEKIIKGNKFGKISRIHGSRDYFKIEPENKNFFIEVIPVLKINNPKEADNVTDLSYFHVNYIRKKLKTEKKLGGARIAKAFCHANKCYGAESYINGFSGYALELLIDYYGDFMSFVKGISKVKDKEIIDADKLYKNKYDITINMNSAKMSSPIVLIDPTFRERNALAALSKETFRNFQETCKKFLKSPSIEMFETEKINLEKIKNKAQKNKYEFILLGAETDKQEGDIAGSKLVKFFKHLSDEIEKFYEIKEKGFEYNGGKTAEFFFVVKKKNEIILSGPEIKDKKENIKKFRQRHKNIFEKKGRLFAREKVDKKINEFIKDWMNKNSQKILEMYIDVLKINT
jgi:tRNA CCA-adding enzyme